MGTSDGGRAFERLRQTLSFSAALTRDDQVHGIGVRGCVVALELLTGGADYAKPRTIGVHTKADAS